jgi:hypothetical protein
MEVAGDFSVQSNRFHWERDCQLRIPWSPVALLQNIAEFHSKTVGLLIHEYAYQEEVQMNLSKPRQLFDHAIYQF